MAECDYDCIVIGGGPAGLVAGLYLQRYRRNILIVDAGDQRVNWAPRIRNLVGYADGISGKELLLRIRKQIYKYKTPIRSGVASIRRKRKCFEVLVGSEILTARKVILAIGMKDVQPQIENLNELRERGLLAYCPICDGFDTSEKRIGILVRDNHGLRKMRFIAQFSPKLWVFQTEKFRVAPQYIKEMRELGVHFYEGPLAWMRASENGKLLIKNQNRRPMPVDQAYVALGTRFNTSALKHLHGLKRNKDGFIVTTSKMKTSIPGLYAIGDCVHGLSQVSVAIGHAATAATKVHNDLLRTDSPYMKRRKHVETSIRQANSKRKFAAIRRVHRNHDAVLPTRSEAGTAR